MLATLIAFLPGLFAIVKLRERFRFKGRDECAACGNPATIEESHCRSCNARVFGPLAKTGIYLAVIVGVAIACSLLSAILQRLMR
jgi:hypothetical protein